MGWRGQAIVIPGRSHSGKTTLVAALLRAGATYYSDEFAVFDSCGRVHPYPTPLSIRRQPGTKPQKVVPESAGDLVELKPLSVGKVVVCEYQPGARWKPRRLSPGRGALALMANAVSIRTKPKSALKILPRVASHALTLKGVRGEADETAGYILRTLEG